MAATAEILPLMATPQVRIRHVPAKEGDSYKIGNMTIRIIEDGTHTGTCSSYTVVLTLHINH